MAPPVVWESDGESATIRWSGGVGPFSLQYALPAGEVGALLRRLRALCVDEGSGFAGRELELKFVGPSGGRTLLGVNADGAVVCANVHWCLAPAERGLLDVRELEGEGGGAVDARRDEAEEVAGRVGVDVEDGRGFGDLELAQGRHLQGPLVASGRALVDEVVHREDDV